VCQETNGESRRVAANQSAVMVARIATRGKARAVRLSKEKRSEIAIDK